MQGSKKALLYLSPVIPALTGSGIAMRAGMVLEALSEHYRVSLIVAPLYATLEREIPEALWALCQNVQTLSPGAVSAEELRRISNASGPFEIVHVFRLAVMEFAHSYLRELRGQVRLHLDLDDIESKTNRRIAEVARVEGNNVVAAEASASAQRAFMMEAIAFRLFERIYVCSELDRRELGERCRGEVRVIQNGVRRPAEVSSPDLSGIFRFLFVGTLGYYPNQDAVRFFCTQVVPFIREKAAGPFLVHVVGSGDSGDLHDLDTGEVHLVGQVADLGPWYRDSDAVVVPVRAGGGTRVKVLEAFSYLRPVVSTTLGVEGIEAVANRDLLVADSAQDFADACVRLMLDRALGPSLVANASDLLSKAYTIDAMKMAVA